MAINHTAKTDAQNQTTASKVADGGKATEQYRGGTQQPANRSFAVVMNGNGFSVPVMNNGNDAVLANWMRLAQKMMPDYQGAEVTATIIKMDRETPGIIAAYSCLIMVAYVPSRNDGYLCYLPIVLEGTGKNERLIERPRRVETLVGGQLTTLDIHGNICLTDIDDDELARSFDDTVARQFPQFTNRNRLPMTYIPGDVVPFTSHEPELVVNNVAKSNINNAYRACVDTLEHFYKIEPISIADFPVKTLHANIAFGNNHAVVNLIDQPVHTSAIVSLTSRQVTNGTALGLNRTGGDEEIVRVSCYTDLVYAPVAQSATPYGYPQGYPGQPVASQKYIPIIVMTGMQMLDVNPSVYALGQFVSTLTVNTANYIRMFSPDKSRINGIDTTDIGALGYEANFQNNANGIGLPIDTKSDDFSDLDAHHLINALIRPEPYLALDIPDVGPETWYGALYSAASSSRSSPQTREMATRAIIFDNDRLTNGHFSRHFKENQPMFVNTDNVIFYGYYFDDKGNKKDIRSIDNYIAIANLSRDNLSTLKAYSNSYLQTGNDITYRLHERRRILDSFVPSGWVLTGRGTRVTFSTQYFNALVNAVKDAGLNVYSNQIYAEGGERGVAQFGSGAGVPYVPMSAASDMFRPNSFGNGRAQNATYNSGSIYSNPRAYR